MAAITRLVIVGYKGRMGQALLGCAAAKPTLEIAGKVDQGDDLRAVVQLADVVVDFSFHDVSTRVAELCAEYRKALVIGTTGHSDDEKARIKKAGAIVPIVWASN